MKQNDILLIIICGLLSLALIVNGVILAYELTMFFAVLEVIFAVVLAVTFVALLTPDKNKKKANVHIDNYNTNLTYADEAKDELNLALEELKELNQNIASMQKTDENDILKSQIDDLKVELETKEPKKKVTKRKISKKKAVKKTGVKKEVAKTVAKKTAKKGVKKKTAKKTVAKKVTKSVVEKKTIKKKVAKKKTPKKTVAKKAPKKRKPMSEETKRKIAWKMERRKKYSPTSDTTKRPAPGTRSKFWVPGYKKADGTYIKGQWRKNASFKGK